MLPAYFIAEYHFKSVTGRSAQSSFGPESFRPWDVSAWVVSAWVDSALGRFGHIRWVVLGQFGGSFIFSTTIMFFTEGQLNTLKASWRVHGSG